MNKEHEVNQLIGEDQELKEFAPVLRALRAHTSSIAPRKELLMRILEETKPKRHPLMLGIQWTRWAMALPVGAIVLFLVLTALPNESPATLSSPAGDAGASMEMETQSFSRSTKSIPPPPQIPATGETDAIETFLLDATLYEYPSSEDEDGDASLFVEETAAAREINQHNEYAF